MHLALTLGEQAVNSKSLQKYDIESRNRAYLNLNRAFLGLFWIPEGPKRAIFTVAVDERLLNLSRDEESSCTTDTTRTQKHVEDWIWSTPSQLRQLQWKLRQQPGKKYNLFCVRVTAEAAALTDS